MDEAEGPGQSPSDSSESDHTVPESPEQLYTDNSWEPDNLPVNEFQEPYLDNSLEPDNPPDNLPANGFQEPHLENSLEPDNLPANGFLEPYLQNSLETDANGFQEPAQASVDDIINDDNESSESFNLQLQEANNILIAAYMEILKIALEAETWVEAPPAFGSMEEIQQMFRSPPPPGMKVELSIESADIPQCSESLVSTMMDTHRWGSTLCNIVYRIDSRDPPGYLQQLCNGDSSYQNLHMVSAFLQLPTPFVKTRKVCFLRFKKEMIPNVWAIVDVSMDYFMHFDPDPVWDQRCQRRPSGVIIRSRGDNSQVIWIENMEVYESQDNMYSAIINSNLAFCARRCVNTFSLNMKRFWSIFTNAEVQVHRQAYTALLLSTDNMKLNYLECVNEAPNEYQWTILSDQGVRILRNIDESQSNNYAAVTSFHVQVKPLTLFHFLVKKNLQLQWPNLEDREEVIRLATYCQSNCITVHKKLVSQNESTELHEYLLQEATKDDFCSFVISSPMTEEKFRDAVLLENWNGILLQSSGFSIMPDDPEGNGSLVTVAIQKQLDVTGTDQAIVDMNNLINDIVGVINEEVISWSDPSG